MSNADEVPDPAPVPAPEGTPPPPGSKSGDIRVICELPNEGGRIETTYFDCVHVRMGEVVGKV